MQQQLDEFTANCQALQKSRETIAQNWEEKETRLAQLIAECAAIQTARLPLLEQEEQNNQTLFDLVTHSPHLDDYTLMLSILTEAKIQLESTPNPIRHMPFLALDGLMQRQTQRLETFDEPVFEQLLIAIDPDAPCTLWEKERARQENPLRRKASPEECQAVHDAILSSLKKSILDLTKTTSTYTALQNAKTEIPLQQQSLVHQKERIEERLRITIDESSVLKSQLDQVQEALDAETSRKAELLHHQEEALSEQKRLTHTLLVLTAMNQIDMDIHTLSDQIETLRRCNEETELVQQERVLNEGEQRLSNQLEAAYDLISNDEESKATYLPKLTSLRALLSSLKSQFHGIVQEKKSAIAAQITAAEEESRAQLNLLERQARQRFFNIMSDMRRHITALQAFGEELSRHNDPCGRVIVTVAKALLTTTDHFTASHQTQIPTQQEYTALHQTLHTTLHGQDLFIEKHSAKWQTLLKNIFATLLSLGALVVYSLIKENRYAFFVDEPKGKEPMHSVETAMQAFALP